MPRSIRDPAIAPEVPGKSVSLRRRAIDTGGRTLRVFAARGVLINAGFDIGLSLLSLAQGFVLATLLSRSAYGIWGILVVSLGVLAQFKAIGISDKYLQQDESDQVLAFQRAFTIELVVTAATTVLLLALLPVVVIVYGHTELIAPGLVLLTVLLADALEAPFWIAYRDMDFARQRRLQAVEPLVSFVVTILLAITGLGYWSLVLGMVAGTWAGAAVAIWTCPYPLRWRFERATLRDYVTFSAPVLVATACTVALANGTMIAANAHLGLAGAGAVALAAKITEFTTRLDALLSGTLYPAICAIQDRVDLLRESFVKSNRLALIWAFPFGIGLTLFAADLVRFVIGEKWHSAITLLAAMGGVAAINHVGFNWDGYFRARADTKPIAVSAVASTLALLAVGVPLLFADGLDGLAIGFVASGVASLAVRVWYAGRLFGSFGILRHGVRSALPTAAGVLIVLVGRWILGAEASLPRAIAALAVYVAVVITVTLVAERSLLEEAVGYLRRRPIAA